MKIFKKFKLKSSKLSAPWFKYYINMRKTLKYPDTSLYNVIEEVADKYPKYPAYSYYDSTVCYEKFIKEIGIVAKSFKEMGINKGDAVTICMPNTPEAILSFYALNKIGAIATMIHPLSSENEIEHYCNLSDSRMIIGVDMVYDKIKSIFNKTKIESIILVSVNNSMGVLGKLGYWWKAGRKLKKIIPDDNTMFWHTFVLKGKYSSIKINDNNKGMDPAAILFSGGTTGKPKGILLSNMNFNSVVMQELEINKTLDLGVSILSIMPVFHGFGLASCIHACFAVGGRSILLPQFNKKKFDELLKKYRPNIIAGVPTLFEALINSKGMNGVDLSFLKCMLCGGDSLSPSLKTKIDNFLKEHNASIEVRTAYGMTECVSGVTMNPIEENRPGSIGIPCPTSYVKIVEPNTYTELPYNQIGEICVHGPSVMLGYVKDPSETALMLREHEDGRIWLHTGDLGSMDEDGFVYFAQRLKRMIISSGYNIYPQHIENIINEHPAVVSCVVVGVDHQYKGQVAKAFIVLKDGIKPTLEIKKSIKEHCTKNIASYMMPYDFEYRESLPTTLVGKTAYLKLMEEENNKIKKS